LGTWQQVQLVVGQVVQDIALVLGYVVQGVFGYESMNPCGMR